MEYECKQKERIRELEDRLREAEGTQRETIVYVKEIKADIEEIKGDLKKIMTDNIKPKEETKLWSPIIQELIRVLGIALAVIGGVKLAG